MITRRDVLIVSAASVAFSAASGAERAGPGAWNVPSFFGPWPSPDNTGPAAGTVLRDTRGTLFSSRDDQIFENLNHTGSIQISHRNCIVRNCIVNGTGCNFNGPVGQNNAIGTPANGKNYNLKVFNCRIFSISGPILKDTAMFDGVFNAMEVAFCDISGCENAIDVSDPINGAAYLHDNYIHDFACWDAVQSPPDGGHTDGLQTYDISNTGGMRIINNTVLGWQTQGTYPTNPQASSSCLACITGQHDLTIDNNLFAGGSYSLYGPSQKGLGGHPVNVHVTNNHFSTVFYPNCGAYGTHSGWDNTAAGFVWSGNVWHDGPKAGRTINPLHWPN
jgi:hypothetical protein